MKLLVIDDHSLVRDALRGLIEGLGADVDVLEASGWSEAAAQLESMPDLDLVLLDLGLPDRDGFEALAELRRDYPGTSIVVLSARNDRHSVTRALDLGASGFIPKSSRREVLSRALNLVLAGGMYIPPEFLGLSEKAPSAIPSGSWAELSSLTPRQKDVLALMMRGMSNKAICRALNLAESTVKNHVTAILQCLRAANRTEAVIAARDSGFDPNEVGGP